MILLFSLLALLIAFVVDWIKQKKEHQGKKADYRLTLALAMLLFIVNAAAELMKARSERRREEDAKLVSIRQQQSYENLSANLESVKLEIREVLSKLSRERIRLGLPERNALDEQGQALASHLDVLTESLRRLQQNNGSSDDLARAIAAVHDQVQGLDDRIAASERRSEEKIQGVPSIVGAKENPSSSQQTLPSPGTDSRSISPTSTAPSSDLANVPHSNGDAGGKLVVPDNSAPVTIAVPSRAAGLPVTGGCMVSIDSPKSGEAVPERITVVGRAAVRKTGKLWILAHKRALGDSWWPQNEASVEDGQFELEVVLGVPSDRGAFEIVAVVVSESTHKVLQRWLATAPEMNYAPTQFPPTLEGCVPAKQTVVR